MPKSKCGPLQLLKILLFLLTMAHTTLNPMIAFAQSEVVARTQIVPDEEKGTVTIVIDGQPVGMFNKEGLHVVGNIRFGGTMMDVGGEEVQATINGLEKNDDGDGHGDGNEK